MPGNKIDISLPGAHIPFFLLSTTFRVLSLAFTLSLLGLNALPLYIGLLLVLVLMGALKVAHTYDEKLIDYIKTESGGLLTLAVSSAVTTTGNGST